MCVVRHNFTRIPRHIPSEGIGFHRSLSYLPTTLGKCFVTMDCATALTGLIEEREMKSIVITFVMAFTALMFVPTAQASDYGDAISGCKAAIQDQVSGDRVTASLGNVKRKGNDKVQLDFSVKVTTGDDRTRLKARCLATRDGQVLDLTLS